MGIKTPIALAALTAAGVAAGITVGLRTRELPAEDDQANAAKGESVAEFRAREADAEADAQANAATGESGEVFKAREVGAEYKEI